MRYLLETGTLGAGLGVLLPMLAYLFTLVPRNVPSGTPYLLLLFLFIPLLYDPSMRKKWKNWSGCLLLLLGNYTSKQESQVEHLGSRDHGYGSGLKIGAWHPWYYLLGTCGVLCSPSEQRQ